MVYAAYCWNDIYCHNIGHCNLNKFKLQAVGIAFCANFKIRVSFLKLTQMISEGTPYLTQVICIVNYCFRFPGHGIKAIFKS